MYLWKIFEYKNKFARKNILQAFYLSLYINSKDPKIETILLDFTDDDLPKFLLIVKKELDRIDDKYTETDLRKSPTELQSTPLTWVYFSLYFLLQLNEKTIQDYKDNKYIKSITYNILLYHANYLRYKHKQVKDQDVEPNTASFFEDATMTLVRMNEYLFSFLNYQSRYLEKIYFAELDSIDTVFLHQFTDSNDQKQSYYFIKNDPRQGNFLVYENHDEDIKIQIDSSRKLRKGSKSNDTFYNTNICHYFAKNQIFYFKIQNLDYQRTHKGKSGGGYRSSEELQDTEEEELIKNIILKPINNSLNLGQEEVSELTAQQKMKRQAFPLSEEKQDIPNGYKQHLRNTAFSANFTKRSLLLTNSYDIPPIPVLKGFLAHLSKPISEDVTLEDVYRSFFVLDCFLGLGYLNFIRISIEDTKYIKLDSNYITIKLNNKLFAKNTNDSYLQKADGNVIYKIPNPCIFLINKVKNFFRGKETKELKKFYENTAAQSYFQFIKNCLKGYDKHIHLNPNQMWKVLNVFRRSMLYEDMSTMFCTSRYQQNDTPALAYTSTNKRAQNHSLFLDILYKELEMHIHIGQLLNIDANLFDKSIEYTNNMIYSGSKIPVSIEQSQSFFKILKSLIKYESDEETSFNLIALYTRYALSLLIGTRPYDTSIMLNNISFSMHVLMVSEKAETMLAGLRMIPLCDEIELIIKQYQELCKTFKIPYDKLYVLINGQYQIYNVKNINNFLDSSSLPQKIKDFVKTVPVNTGRHVITKTAMESNFNIYYLKAFLGHYMAGGEQLGVFSTLDIPDYIQKTRELTSNIAKIYGV